MTVDRCDRRRIAFRWILAIVVGFCTIQSTVNGQDSITRAPVTSQFVPPVAPRPMPSPLEQRNLSQRGTGDQDSIASLVQNVQGSDATIEVIVGRGRLITLQEPLASPEGKEIPVVAVGDPTVLDFDILPNSRMIRVLGRRIGMTDLSVVTSTGKVYTFEVRVTYDLNLLRAYIRQLFPNADLQMVQMYEHVVVEGEASSTDQVYQIIQAMQGFLSSSQVARKVKSETAITPLGGRPTGREPTAPVPDGETPGAEPTDPYQTPLEGGVDDKPDVSATLPAPRIINLIRVPGVQQVMLQVKVAEVDRTALRQMGAGVLYRDSSGRTFGSIPGNAVPATGDDGGLIGLMLGSSATAFAILPNTELNIVLEALRANQVLSVLAEPNLTAMHGQKASFLAGGEFPIPVPQGVGNNVTYTVQFKEFGVLLDFVPYIMEDGSIRLHVAPEVSTIDPAISVDLPGISVPGVATRRVNTTVELQQGQTLALAGLLSVSMEANTNRLPGLGDLPYLGPFFSNNSHQRVEKELVILVTPQFVNPMEPQQVGPLPGCEIADPDDREFYWLNRIESRSPTVNPDYRATNGWDDPLRVGDHKTGQRRGFFGPYGYSK